MSEEINEQDELEKEESQANQDEKDWKAEAAKQKAIAERMRKKLEKAQSSLGEDEEKEQPPAQPSSEEDRYVRLDLKVDGYNEDEINFILKNGGKQALEDPYVKAAVEARREQRKAEEAMVATDSNKSDIFKRFTPEQIQAMSAAEMEKAMREGKI